MTTHSPLTTEKVHYSEELITPLKDGCVLFLKFSIGKNDDKRTRKSKIVEKTKEY